MAAVFRTILLLLTVSESFIGIFGIGVGINYGRIANNLPTPSHVSVLLRSLNISRVKVYDADPAVLGAFAGTDVEFIVAVGNDLLQKMRDPQQAQSWVQQNVQPYISQTKITCITVGNEVLGGGDNQLATYLLPAMKTVYGALVDLGLSKQVYVDSPFFINAYPYFAYKSDPNNVQLEYVLFEPNNGAVDPNTNLKYDNMLYAQIDAVYSAIKALGHSDVEVKISETGWPSKGDEDDPGATVQNAGIYNRNLMQRMQQGQSTPARPSQPIDIYLFALFNENQSPVRLRKGTLDCIIRWYSRL
ncbi:hypothetical protein OSB04_013523 [Centaurea solstitialis]|uniref:Uncharacterized protein n=1 Tax=Centaurea solstitialis TaxID=347529 RepID=A0AA38TF89_9ASTR|nr:hypothetical protein OSB04_013523 [Centaurea solstitialis]